MSLVENAHRQSVRVPMNHATALLQEMLTRRLTAYIAGVKDVHIIEEWASGREVDIPEDTEQRLRTAFEIIELLTQFDSPATVRAWFVGMNPQLADTSPAKAIHEGRLSDALSAARAFIAGG